MPRINTKRTIVLAVSFCCPAALWATGGSEDYGIIMALAAFFFSLPVGLVLLAFIVYSIIILKKEKLDKRHGKIVFIVSLVIMISSIIIPIVLMHLAKWHRLMIELMLADFIPVLLLSVISAVLSVHVMKRPLLKESEPSAYKKKLLKRTLIGLALIISLLLILMFLYFFT